MTSIGNHSYGQGCITNVRRKGRILQLDNEWLLLCRDDDVAKALKEKLSGPINDNLDPVDFDPDEETNHPVSIQLGPYVSKMIHLMSCSNSHDQCISGWGLNLDDLNLLEKAGFGYRPGDVEQPHNDQNVWTRDKAQTDQARLNELESLIPSMRDTLSENDDTFLQDDFPGHPELSSSERNWDLDNFLEERERFNDLLQQLPGDLLWAGDALAEAAKADDFIFETLKERSPPAWAIVRILAKLKIELAAEVERDEDEDEDEDDQEAVLSEAIERLGSLGELSEEDRAPVNFLLACRAGELEIARAMLDLLEKSPAVQSCPESCDPEWIQRGLITACRYGHLPVIEFLLERGSLESLGNACLDDTCVHGNVEVVEFLLQKGVSPHPVLKNCGLPSRDVRFDPLRTAAFDCYSPADEAILKLLLDAGAKQDESLTASGCPLIHVAAKDGHAGVLGVLLERHPDATNAISREITVPADEYEHSGEEGVTPLLWAVMESQESTVESLIEAGAPIDAFNSKGENPLTVACRRGDLEMVSFLLSKGADPNAKDKEGKSALAGVIEQLVEQKKQLNLYREDTDTLNEILEEILGEDLAPSCVSVGYSGCWTKSTNWEQPEDDALALFKFSAFMQPTEACNRLEEALEMELQAGTWCQYGYDSSRLDGGLFAPLSAFKEIGGGKFAEWQKIEEEWFEITEERDEETWITFVDEKLPELTDEINDALRAKKLPDCSLVFAYPEPGRIMFGSDIFDEYQELHVVFPDELYELNPDREKIHRHLGSPEISGFAVVSY